MVVLGDFLLLSFSLDPPADVTQGTRSRLLHPWTQRGLPGPVGHQFGTPTLTKWCSDGIRGYPGMIGR